MTTQAITDIKELVGEMPARGCEWQQFEGEPLCGSAAQWAIRVHFLVRSRMTCEVAVQNFCDEHKRALMAIPKMHKGTPCFNCGVSADALFGPVMPL